jgi:hypothetical protein
VSYWIEFRRNSMDFYELFKGMVSGELFDFEERFMVDTFGPTLEK